MHSYYPPMVAKNFTTRFSSYSNEFSAAKQTMSRRLKLEKSGTRAVNLLYQCLVTTLGLINTAIRCHGQKVKTWAHN